MKGRKIFALVCGLAMLGQNMQGYAAEIYAAETASSTAVTLDADFISAVSVSDKVYDGTPDAAADLSGVVLNGADVATRVVMLTTQGILTTFVITVFVYIFDWRIGLLLTAESASVIIKCHS